VRLQSLAVTMFAALFLGSACSPEQSPPPAPPKPKVVEITLLPPKIPERASELQPDVVLFLPMVNRTARRIHPSYVRGFDRTLAAFADSQLGLRVVDPEIAGALSREMGFPDDYEAESSFAPNEESLNQAARRVGAGVVVWGELLPDQRVNLHAKALHPGADAVPWDGAGVKLEGSPDEAYFDGPRQLLRPWRSERISQDEEIPASAREELALAVRQAAQIDPTGIERAQATLSRLAESYPLWNAPWLELTALSARRVQWLGIGRDARVLDLAPIPARHMAHLLAINDEQRARLDALDWFFVRHVRPNAILDDVIANLPPNAIERLLLAEVDGAVARNRFGLEGLELESVAENVLRIAEMTPGGFDAGVAATIEYIEKLEADQVAGNYLTNIIFLHWYIQNGDWNREKTIADRLLAHRLAGSLEVLRQACVGLEAEATARCRAPLDRLLPRDGGGELAAGDWTDEAWERRVEEWLALLFGDQLMTTAFVELPDDAIFKKDPDLRPVWIAPAEVIRVTNAVLAARREAVGPVASTRDLVSTSSWRRIDDGLDEVFGYAFTRARIYGLKRGNRKQGWQYVKPFRSFLAHRSARHEFAEVQSSGPSAAEQFTAARDLVRLHPYDGRWATTWLAWAKRSGEVDIIETTPEKEARFYESLLPRTVLTHWHLVKAWEYAGRPERGTELIDELSGATGRPFFALYRDEDLAKKRAPLGDRIDRLERAAFFEPEDAKIALKLTNLLIDAKRYDDAEKTVQFPLTLTAHFVESCRWLAVIKARRGQVDAGGEILQWCAENAPNKWSAARMWVDYGWGLLHRNRWEAGMEAFNQAERQVGGAAWVLEPKATAHFWHGQGKRAIEITDRLVETYGDRGDTGSRQIWEYYWTYAFGTKERPKAIDSVLDDLKRDTEDTRGWWTLRYAYYLQNDVEGYVHLLRNTPGKGPKVALRNVLFEMGNIDEGVQVADRLIARYPDDGAMLTGKAMQLHLKDRNEEAWEIYRPYLDEHPDEYEAVWTGLHVLEELGRLDEAWELLNAYSARNPGADISTMKIRLHRGAGDKKAAMSAIRKARNQVPWHFNPYKEERYWLPIEVELGIPPAGTPDYADLEHRIESALMRKVAVSKLWEILADVREHGGDTAGAVEAREMAAQLKARQLKARRLSKEPLPAAPAPG